MDYKEGQTVHAIVPATYLGLEVEFGIGIVTGKYLFTKNGKVCINIEFKEGEMAKSSLGQFEEATVFVSIKDAIHIAYGLTNNKKDELESRATKSN